MRRCWICESLSATDRRELDYHVTHPASWPDDEGAHWVNKVPSRAAMSRMGLLWLTDHEHSDITPRALRAHLDHRATAAPAIDALVVAESAGVMALTGYYSEAIAAGRKALKRLVARIDDKDDPLTSDELFRLAALGGRYALSAAQLRQRGASPLPGDEGYVPPLPAEPPPPPPPAEIAPPPKIVNPIDGFLAGSAPRPSKRVGSVRVRTIEGVSRPVHDEGPKDREHYNKRADEEGSPRI